MNYKITEELKDGPIGVRMNVRVRKRTRSSLPPSCASALGRELHGNSAETLLPKFRGVKKGTVVRLDSTLTKFAAPEGTIEGGNYATVRILRDNYDGSFDVKLRNGERGILISTSNYPKGKWVIAKVKIVTVLFGVPNYRLTTNIMG